MRTVAEARAARLAAEETGDVTAWVRARALEEFLGRTAPYDPDRHPRNREGQFINVLSNLNKGEGVRLPSGVHVTKLGKGKYEVRGGVSATRKDKGPRTVHTKTWAARDALDRHGVVKDAEHIGKLKKGEEHVVGHVHVTKTDDHGPVTVYPKLKATKKSPATKLGDSPELEKKFDSAIDAARHARRLAALHADKEIVAPDLRTVAREKSAPPLAKITPKTHGTVERVDKALPSDARGDVNVAAAEHVPVVGDVLVKGENSAFEKPAQELQKEAAEKAHEEAEKAGHHLAGHADPGVSADAHIHAAQHGHQIAGHVQDHAHELLAKAAPHVGTGKHRAALKSAHHTIQHLASQHAGDAVHTIGHIAHHLLSSRYDAAKAARIAAERTGDTTEWTRARALEEYWGRRLEDSRADSSDTLGSRGHHRSDLFGGDRRGPSLDDLEGLAEAAFDPNVHPRGRTGKFIDSLRALPPHGKLSHNGFTIERLPPLRANPNSIGDINPGAMGSKGLFRMVKPDGQVTTRKTPEQVAELVGGSGAGKGNVAGEPVPDLQAIIKAKIAELHKQKAGTDAAAASFLVGPPGPGNAYSQFKVSDVLGKHVVKKTPLPGGGTHTLYSDGTYAVAGRERREAILRGEPNPTKRNQGEWQDTVDAIKRDTAELDKASAFDGPTKDGYQFFKSGDWMGATGDADVGKKGERQFKARLDQGSKAMASYNKFAAEPPAPSKKWSKVEDAPRHQPYVEQRRGPVYQNEHGWKVQKVYRNAGAGGDPRLHYTDAPKSKYVVIDPTGRQRLDTSSTLKGAQRAADRRRAFDMGIHPDTGKPLEGEGKQGRPKGKADPGVGVPDPSDPPDPTSPVNIGVTPYRGPAQPPGADIAGYYDTPRYKQFQSRVRKDAESRGLRVTNFDKVAGLWDGNKEPAVSVTVCCDTEKAHAMARDLGEHYNQDGVMTFTPDTGGGAFLYRTTDTVDTAKALAALKAHGVMGGRIQGGKLEVIDTDGSAADAVFKIAADLDTNFHYDVGNATLLEKGRDYLAEGHLGEAASTPEDEADAGGREAEGHDDHTARQGARAVVEAYLAGQHPRDRTGRWVAVLRDLQPGWQVSLPGGINVKRHEHSGHYEVTGSMGTRFVETAEAAAKVAERQADNEVPVPSSQLRDMAVYVQ